MLERFDVSLYEKDKETYLLNKISVNNKEIKTTISIIRRRLATFNEAYSYLTTEACMIPPQTSSVYRRSSINVMNEGRGCSHKHGGGSFGGLGRGNDSVCGRGHKGRGGNDKVINGVEIRNPN